MSKSDKWFSQKPIIFLIVFIVLLFLCCICCSLFIFMGSFTPPELELTSSSNIAWTSDKPTELIKFKCVAIEDLQINGKQLSRSEINDICGSKGHEIELKDGVNTFKLIGKNMRGDSTEVEISISFNLAEYNNKKDLKNTPESTPIPTVPQFTSYINAEDFKKKSFASIKNKYGEPTELNEEVAPVASYFYYDKGDYSFEGNYYDNDPTVYGASIFFDNQNCNVNDFNFEFASSALKYVQLDKYKNNNWKEVKSYFKQYRLENVDDWGAISITCTDENIFKISFYPEGYLNR